jgi:hypothetical protein
MNLLFTVMTTYLLEAILKGNAKVYIHTWQQYGTDLNLTPGSAGCS